jgi:cell division septal protein FtsQ
LVVLFFILVVVLAFRSDLFVVHEVSIRVEPQEAVVSLVADEVKLATDLAKSQSLGRSIFFVDTARIVGEVKKNFLTIRDVSVAKDYPNRLTFTFFPRLAAAEIDVWPAPASASAGRRGKPEERLVSDEEGFLFARVASRSALPAIDVSVEGEVKVGERLPGERIRFALDLMEALKSREMAAAEIALKGEESVQVRLRSGTLVIFSQSKEREKQLAALQTLLSRHRMEGRRAKEIDLRFAKPVVRY